MARKVDAVVEAIAKYEGFYKAGSRAQRNNNPGNLRFSLWAEKNDDGFAVFPTPEVGFMALRYDIERKCQGKTVTGLTPNSTVADLFAVYAPKEDGNDPEAYTWFVCNEAGVKPEDRLFSLLGENSLSLGEENDTKKGEV